MLVGIWINNGHSDRRELIPKKGDLNYVVVDSEPLFTNAMEFLELLHILVSLYRNKLLTDLNSYFFVKFVNFAGLGFNLPGH